MKTSLQKTISNWKRPRILVIGDVILDRYIHGAVNRISPEAPIPVLEVETRTSLPGGAANVADKLISLRAKVKLIGVVGSDKPADELRSLLKERKISTAGLVATKTRNTTCKTRILSQGSQLLRVDDETDTQIMRYGSAHGKVVYRPVDG